MKFFKKDEAIAVFIILLVLGAVTAFNLNVSFRKSRDARRKGDLRAISESLIAYQEDFASFPASKDGKIVACLDGYDSEGIPQRKQCEWGWDGLTNIFNASQSAYIKTLPTDPNHNSGGRYLYLSNGRTFQIYASLEGKDEAEYDLAIVARNLNCGNKICNYGIAFKDTPLDKSIEEYENEVRAKTAK